jgi:hypothetical protein
MFLVKTDMPQCSWYSTILYFTGRHWEELDGERLRLSLQVEFSPSELLVVQIRDARSTNPGNQVAHCCRGGSQLFVFPPVMDRVTEAWSTRFRYIGTGVDTGTTHSCRPLGFRSLWSGNNTRLIVTHIVVFQVISSTTF